MLTLNESHSLEDSIETLSRSALGSSAAIFTSSGAAARKFRYEVPAGDVGVNIGVAAPMAYFPFSGWRDSFMGVLHGQGRMPSSSTPIRRCPSSAGPRSGRAGSRKA